MVLFFRFFFFFLFCLFLFSPLKIYETKSRRGGSTKVKGAASALWAKKGKLKQPWKFFDQFNIKHSKLLRLVKNCFHKNGLLQYYKQNEFCSLFKPLSIYLIKSFALLHWALICKQCSGAVRTPYWFFRN